MNRCVTHAAAVFNAQRVRRVIDIGALCVNNILSFMFHEGGQIYSCLMLASWHLSMQHNNLLTCFARFTTSVAQARVNFAPKFDPLSTCAK